LSSEDASRRTGYAVRMRRWTAYHLTCEELLADRKRPDFEVEAELKLGVGPPRTDFLLLRQRRTRRRGHAKMLLRLWALLPAFTVVEYKSPGRPLRRGEFARLMAYAHLFQSKNRNVRDHKDLAVVLLVARLTPIVDRELASQGWSREPLGDGYYRLNTAPFKGFVVDLEQVAVAENDELLALIAEGKMRITTDAAFRWFRAHVLQGPRSGEMQRLESYDKVLKRALGHLTVEDRLEGLKPEDLVKRLKPEERVKGLTPVERIKGLKPAEIRELLRALPKELPPPARRRSPRRPKSH